MQAKILRAIRAGLTEGEGLRLTAAPGGSVIVSVPTPDFADVIVMVNGKWREGFEDGPWVAALDRLLARAPGNNSKAAAHREKQRQAAIRAMKGQTRG